MEVGEGCWVRVQPARQVRTLETRPSLTSPRHVSYDTTTFLFVFRRVHPFVSVYVHLCARIGIEKKLLTSIFGWISSRCVLKESCPPRRVVCNNFLTDATFRRGPFTEEHIGSPLLPLRIPTLRTVQLGDLSFISGPSACACIVPECLQSHVCHP
jgi:hypothetical protein